MKNKLILLILLSAATYGLASPLKIIGNDDRVQITDQNAKPFHNSIGYLSLRIDDSLYACTATVIGARHAITSAHCIYNARTYRMVDKASFIPALRSERKKTQYPYGFFQTSKMRILPDFASKLSYKHDLALITFAKDLPVKAMKLGILPKNSTFFIAGYPSDKVDGTLWEASGKRKTYLWGYGPETDEHDVDTMPGQSGSALRYTKDNLDLVVGIHSGGKDDMNVAYFFTEKSIQILNQWMKEDLE